MIHIKRDNDLTTLPLLPFTTGNVYKHLEKQPLAS